MGTTKGVIKGDTKSLDDSLYHCCHPRPGESQKHSHCSLSASHIVTGSLRVALSRIANSTVYWQERTESANTGSRSRKDNTG